MPADVSAAILARWLGIGERGEEAAGRANESRPFVGMNISRLVGMA
jgi:hypothetical protein